MNSILTSVKKLLGIAEECTDFDADIIMYINMALFALVQMGVGPGEGYAISGKENEWTEFVADPVKVEAVKHNHGSTEEYRLRDGMAAERGA